MNQPLSADNKEAVRVEVASPTFNLTIEKKQLHAVLTVLNQRYCAYYPALTRLLDSPKASLMLSHSLGLTKFLTRKSSDGWFWKTAGDWHKDIGLTPKESESARKILVELGLIEYELRGMPAKTWYRVNLNRLAQLIYLKANKPVAFWEWGDKTLIDLLGRPILYYQAIAGITDNVIASIYLSFAVSKYRQSTDFEMAGNSGFFHLAIKAAENYLCLGTKELYGARLTLEEKNLIVQEREKCLNPRLLTRVNLHEMLNLIQINHEETKKTLPNNVTKLPLSPENKRTFQNSKTRTFQKGEPRTFQNSETKRFQNSEAGTFQNGETCSPVLEGQNNNNINIFNTPPISPPPFSNEENNPGGVGGSFSEIDLIYPSKLMLMNEEKQIIFKLLKVLSLEKAQLILDEVQGQLLAGANIPRVIGYVRKLCAKELEGQFIPEMAFRAIKQRTVKVNAPEVAKTNTQLVQDSEQYKQEIADRKARYQKHMQDRKKKLGF